MSDGPGRTLIVCATEGEHPVDLPVAAEVLVCGVGKSAAAVAITRRLAEGGVSAVVSFGLAGAYARAELAVGDVVVARSVRIWDEGLDTGGRFVPFVDRMPVPGAGERRTDARLVRTLMSHKRAPFRLEGGLILTVSSCAGSRRLATEREDLGALAEGMEGAAVGLAAEAFELPFVELRGISNLCGPRRGAPFDAVAPVAHASQVLARLFK